MVEQSLQYAKSLKPQEVGSSLLKFTSVSIQEIIKRGYGLKASFYSAKGSESRKDLERCKWDVVPFCDSFIKDAFYGSRSKRTYIGKSNKEAVGFLGSSEMLSVNPKPVKFLLKEDGINKFSVQKGQVLLSRSGTIGNVAYVNLTLEKYFVSEHAIRISCKEYSGYVYAFLKSRTGRNLIESNMFGAVISQIEPEHLNNTPIPDPPPMLKEEIHNLIEESFKLRDESNELMDEGQDLLKEALQMPNIEKLQAKTKQFDKKASVLNYSLPLSEICNRLDGSYHVPIVQVIEQHLHKNAKQVTYIGDKKISQSIILPERFTRTYVEEDNGIVFFGGKQIYELDPSNKKYLSLAHHEDRIKNRLTLHENMTMITRSGTVGKIAIVPKHWEGWTASEHIIRVVPANSRIAGYLHAWLSSDYAYPLITRFIYGAVVDEIDDKQVAQVSIPLLQDVDAQKEINDKVLKANKKRAKAYELEQEALKTLNEKVIYAR